MCWKQLRIVVRRSQYASFLRAAGFSMYQKKKDIRALLRCLAKRREPPAVFSLTGRPNYMRSRQKLRRGSAWRCMGS